MLLMGDETLRSQQGNNNAYCQDNALSWFDWNSIEANRAMLRFTRELIALRRRHPCLMANRFFDGQPVRGRGIPDVTWYGARISESPWHDREARFLAFTVAGLTREEEDLYVVLNMSEQTVDTALPSISDRRWHLALDTSRPSPEDILAREQQKLHPSPSYSASPRSVIVLEGRS
jgi:glycogen operon protein